MKPTNLIIAGERLAACRDLHAVLAHRSHIRIVATCTDGSAALHAIKNLAPDVAFVEIAMPSMNGLEVLGAVHAERLPTRIVLIADDFAAGAFRAARAAGALGIVAMNGNRRSTEYAGCVSAFERGRPWISRNLLDRFGVFRRKRTPATGFDALTARERQVANLVRHGLSNKAIALRLKIAEGTVKLHLHHIYGKTAAASRIALAMMARPRANRDPHDL